MSDPVSNAEVEDVLASIRRLVSEENRSAPVPKPRVNVSETPAGSRGRAAGDAGKLVLTPSLRVMEPSEPAAKQDADEEKVAAADIGGAEALEDAGSEAAVETTETAPTTDDAPTDTPAIDDDARAAENARAAAALVLGLNAALSRDDTAPVNEGSDWLSEDKAASDKLETPLVRQEDTHQEAPDMSITASEEPMGDVRLFGDAAKTHVDADPVAAPMLATDWIAEDAQSNPKGLSAKIAALEAAVGRRRDTEWEPDGVTADEPLSGTKSPTLAWEDHIVEPARDPEPAFENVAHLSRAPAPKVALEPSSDETHEEPALSDLTDEAAFLDEEALYDMVAEIVRQELQGALGERITRNVRKLVRREIQRALAAHDLD